MDSIKVSIIIPTYKRSVMLDRAITSVLDQTYRNIEILVVDDNNNGDVYRESNENLMKKYEKDEKVIYIKHNKNQNGSAARNTGIKYSAGTYISFLDDDDFYLPTKIENQVNLLNTLDSSYGGVFCLHVRRYKEFAYSKSNCLIKEDGNYKIEFLSNKVSMPSSTLMIKKSIIDHIGLFDVSFNRHQDLEFLIRFYRKYKMGIVPEYNVIMQTDGFRNYPSGTNAHQIKYKFYETFSEDFNLIPPDDLKAITHFQWIGVGCFYLKERKFIAGIKIIREYVFPNSNSKLKDLFHIAFFLVSSIFPKIKIIYCFIIASTSLREFSFRNLKYNPLG